MTSPLSIYIHWPFCKSKCPYCDFNSHVRDSVEHDRWQSALLKELAHYAAVIPDREVVSIFFGGGTPSLMQAQTVAALIDAAAMHWPMARDTEITLEANPTSVEAQKLKDFRTAGVNRVSLGVQALNAEALAFLGRQHSEKEALGAVSMAREIFPRMSFDLIYARPHQTLAEWEKELTRALTFAKGHMSLYQLTIEENTAFHAAQRRGELPTLEDDTAADMYELTARIMQAHGMCAYEISNYAAMGQESRHNLAYWRGDDYIGIGPGAHGRYKECVQSAVGDRAPFITCSTENTKSPERWLDKVEAAGCGPQVHALIEDDDRLRELVMMGLRLTAGIDFADWQQRTGLDVRQGMNASAVKQLCAEDLLKVDENCVRVTGKGMLLLNSVTGRLLA